MLLAFWLFVPPQVELILLGVAKLTAPVMEEVLNEKGPIATPTELLIVWFTVTVWPGVIFDCENPTLKVTCAAAICARNRATRPHKNDIKYFTLNSPSLQPSGSVLTRVAHLDALAPRMHENCAKSSLLCESGLLIKF